MRFPTASLAVALVASTGAVPGCGSEEIFEPRLAANEQLIERSATARLAKDDEGIEQLTVVGDLDGDGIADAVVRSFFLVPSPTRGIEFSSALYVVYGGSAVTGKIELASLPALTDLGAFGAGVASAGDVDGDGLADFLAGAAFTPGCGGLVTDEDELHSGAYLVYGSPTRLTGARPIAEVGVFLRDATPCTAASAVAGLGDLDGDGAAELAIGRTPLFTSGPIEVFVFYGRGERFPPVVDLAASDAVIRVTTPQGGVLPGIASLGDVDGDGHGDFLFEIPLGPTESDVRLVRGAAARLAGTVAPDDIAQSRFIGNGRCFSIASPASALGDLDGDGLDDFALTSCVRDDAFNVQRVQRVFYGRAVFPAQIGAEEADATFRLTPGPGGAIAGADVDGDGIRDLLVSDTGLHEGNGGVHLLSGDGARLSGAIEFRGFGNTYVGKPRRATICGVVLSTSCIAQEMVGADLGVGDMTGDHRADFLVSAPTNQFTAPVLGQHGSALGHAYLVSPPASTRP